VWGLLISSIHRLVRVSDVKEKVLFVVLLVEGAHGGGGGWDDVVDKEEEGVLWPERDPFPDEEIELTDGQVGGNEVLLLVQLGDPGFGCALHDHWNAVWVLPADLFSL